MSEHTQTRNRNLPPDDPPDADDGDATAIGRRTVLKLAGISSVSLAGIAAEDAAASGTTTAVATVGYGVEEYGASGYGGTN